MKEWNVRDDENCFDEIFYFNVNKKRNVIIFFYLVFLFLSSFVWILYLV